MNPNIKHGGGGNRNFGLEGAGKGDSDRTHDKTAYNENLDAVNFPRVPVSADPTFTKSKRGYKKVFGVEDKTKPNPNWVDAPPAPANVVPLDFQYPPL